LVAGNAGWDVRKLERRRLSDGGPVLRQDAEAASTIVIGHGPQSPSSRYRQPNATLRNRRLRVNVDAVDHAEAAGLNPLQVGHIERGARDVKLSTIVKLAHALGPTASE